MSRQASLTLSALSSRKAMEKGEQILPAGIGGLQGEKHQTLGLGSRGGRQKPKSDKEADFSLGLSGRKAALSMHDFSQLEFCYTYSL